MPSKTTTTKKAAKNEALKNPVIAALVKGHTTVAAKGSDYVRIVDGTKTFAQLADRANGAILENLPDEVEALASKALKESGKGGTGRYVVGEGDVDKARELIQAAHVARVKQIEAKVADKPKATTAKPSGKRARARGTAAKRSAAKVA